MNFWQWCGLILMVAPWLTVGAVFRFDLLLFESGRETFSQYIWANWDLYKAGLADFPRQIIVLPLSIAVAGNASASGLFIHLIAG